MDSTALIWIIVVIAVALVAVGVIAFVSRRNGARRDARQHEKAEELRAQARQSAVAAEELEAQRARAQADAATARAEAERAKARAAQAEVDARRAAEENASELEKHRQEHAENLRKADELDPYVDDDRTAATGASVSHDGTHHDGTHVDDRGRVVDPATDGDPTTDRRDVPGPRRTGSATTRP